MTTKSSDSYKIAMEQMAYTLVISPCGKIQDANRLFLSNYKLKTLPEDIKIFDFVWGQYNYDYYERILNHIAKGFTWRDEIKMSFQEIELWMDMNLAPLDEDGNILLFGFDISERKKNEEIIKLQQQQLFTQSQFSALGEMASGIAHEINNPLAIISASTAVIQQALKQKNLDKEFFKKIIIDVNSTVSRISKIIQGLRNISRDPNKDEFEMVVLPDLIEDVLALCREKFRGRGIDLRVNGLEEFKALPLELLKIQISQVILNLLNNSFDAIQSEDITDMWIELQVIHHSEDDEVSIIVTDSGSGISKEIADKIFNPFFTTKDIGKGTGLGLSLSNAIIKRHKGQFYINHENSNTQFVIKIPRFQNSRLSSLDEKKVSSYK